MLSDNKKYRHVDIIAMMLWVPASAAMLFFLPFVLLPICLMRSIRHWMQETRLVHTMKKKGRYRDWELIEDKLLVGEGTIIIERGANAPVRFWWTDEKVMLIAPHPIPHEDQLDYRDSCSVPSFVSWCYHRYIDAEIGTAVLCDPPLLFPRGCFLATFFRTRYPNINAVDTVYYRPR